MRSLSRATLIFAVVLGQILLLLAVMCYLLDWPLGVIEAISLSVFVGFSIDYPMHVCLAFATELKHSRDKPVKAMRLALLVSAAVKLRLERGSWLIASVNSRGSRVQHACQVF